MPVDSNPNVSVIIPVYNGARHILAALNSVFEQTYQDLEILVIDDGSTDETKSSIEHYIRNRTIQYIYQSNRGLSSARNAAIRSAAGRFLKFLDCDDILYPKQIELQVDHLKDQRNIISMTDHVLAFENGKEKISHIDLGKTNQLARFITGNFTPVHSILVETDLVKAAGGFDEQLTSLEDADLWIRLLFRGVQFEKVDYVGCCYRVFENSLSSHSDQMFFNKCRISERVNDFLLSAQDSMDPEVLEAVLLNNTRLIEGCFIRGLKPEKHLNKTLAFSEVLFLRYKTGFRKIFLQSFGLQAWIRLKHHWNCLRFKNYQNALRFDEIKWRNAAS